MAPATHEPPKQDGAPTSEAKAKDFLAGLLFVAIGGVVAFIGRKYFFGTAARMGPGYMPMVLATGTILLGLFISARALPLSRLRIEGVAWRPLLLILGAVASFALLIEPAGLIVASIVTALIGGLAARDIGMIELFVLAVLLAVFAAVVFVWALGQPFALWPGSG